MPGLSVSPFRCDITPTAPIPLAGYQRRTGEWTHIEQSLEVNGIIADTADGPVALIAIDTLFASTALETAARTALPDAAQKLHMLFLASHTHAAPSLDPSKPLLGAFNPEYFAQTAEAIATAVSDAKPRIADHRRACNASVKGAVYRRKTAISLGRHRPFVRKLTGMLPDADRNIPDKMQLHVFEDASDRPIFAVWSWPCHPLSTANLQAVSSDFPGRVRDGLRDILNAPDLPVLYAPGFCGDIRPEITTGPMSLRSAVRHPLSFGTKRIFRRSQTADQTGLVDNLLSAITAIKQAPATQSDCDASFVKTDLSAANLVHKDGNAATVSVARLALGGLNIVGVGAEVACDHATRLSALFPGPCLLTGCADNTVCYLPTDAQIPESGYEVDGFRPGFGITGHWRVGIDDALEDAVKRTLS